MTDESIWSKAQPRGISRSLPRRKTGLASNTKKSYIKSKSHCLIFYQSIVGGLYTIISEGKFTQSHAQDYLEVTIERHYTDIKELMTSYQKLILENQVVLEELDMECQEKINEDMAYALSYLSIYNNQLNVPKMHREMNNLMIIYGLSDMIYRGMTLVKFYAPNGVMLSEILHSCFCSHYNKTDVEVQQELGIGRTSFYKMKKQALGYLGFYFYEIVVPQAKDKRFKPSLGVEEE